MMSALMSIFPVGKAMSLQFWDGECDGHSFFSAIYTKSNSLVAKGTCDCLNCC